MTAVSWAEAESGWVLGCRLGKVELQLLHLTRHHRGYLVTTGDGYWPEIQGYHHDGSLEECLAWARETLAAHGLGWPGEPR